MASFSILAALERLQFTALFSHSPKGGSDKRGDNKEGEGQHVAVTSRLIDRAERKLVRAWRSRTKIVEGGAEE